MNSLKIMTCGNVDDGKSTLLGRLLYETGNVTKDQLENLKILNDRFNTRNNELDFSLLLDGLLDEKEQGITIDIAFKYFVIQNTQITLIDSPGHVEFTRNMANAATFADTALIILDSTKKIKNQTKKHLKITNLFPNIKKRIVCINKLDLVDYSEDVFLNYSKELQNYALKNNLIIDNIIPVSSLFGDNLVKKSKNTPYYKGKPLLDYITQENTPTKYKNGSLNVKFIIKQKNKRIYFIENNGISYKVGDQIKNVYTNEITTIQKIYSDNSLNDSIGYKRHSAIEIGKPISINKGDSLVLQEMSYVLSNSFKAKIVWVDKEELVLSKRYLIKFKHTETNGFVSKTRNKTITKNSISELQIELEKKIFFDSFKNNYELSQFVVIDLFTKKTVGFGYVLNSLDKGSHVHTQILQNYKKNKINKCIWLTGLPGSGKTSIAKALSKKFHEMNIDTYILDGDNIRNSINQDLGFTQSDRVENNRRIAHISKILFDAGIMPIVATVSPNEISRNFAKSLYKDSQFSLIYIKASIETCIKRDPKGLYSSPTKYVKNISGLDSNFEEPYNPSLTIDTENLSIKKSVEKIIEKIIIQ